MRKLLSLFLTLSVAVSVFAYNVEIDSVCYSLNAAGEAMVTYRNSSAAINSCKVHVVIPATIEVNGVECPVTSIGQNAFRGCSMLRSITIPSSVKSVGNNAFQDCDSLSSIAFPDSVTTIGNLAFSGCEALGSVILPKCLRSISNSLFLNCSALTSIVVPDSVVSIGSSAFSGCTSLVSITIPTNTTSIGNNAFLKTPYYENFADGVVYIGTMLYAYKGDMPANTSVIIKEGTTCINDYAFSNKNELVSVTIPNSVVTIGNSAFRGCSSLGNIVLPNSVTTIGNSAFSNCSGITSITIPYNVSNLNSSVFSGCGNLTSIVWNARKYKLGNNSANPSMFNSAVAGQITSFVIGQDVDSIPAGLCSGMKKLRTIEIPSGVVGIGGSAFRNCNSLLSVDLPAQVDTIGDYAFGNNSCIFIYCEGNKPSRIGNNVISSADAYFIVSDTTVYKSAWSDYKEQIIALSQADVNVTVFANSERSALHQALGLKTMENIVRLKVNGTINSYDIMMMRNQMPKLCDLDLSDASIVANSYEYTKGYCSKDNTLTSYAFTGTGTHIRRAILPNTVTSIEQNAFNPTYLQEVVLPRDLRVVGGYTFSGHSALYSVTLGDNVEGIEYGAFMNCSSLQSINIPNGVKYINNHAFYGCSALRSINLPESLTSIGESAFQGAGLTEVTIPASVETIGEKVFAGGNEDYSRYEYYYCSASDNSTCRYYYTPYSGGSLQTLVIPADSKLKTISAWAFAGNRNLKNVSILGDSIKSIQDGAFYRCQLDTLILPPNLTELNTLSFGECTGLKFIAMPNTLTEIASNAFVGCTNLDNVQFPKKLTKIGHHAFADCTNLSNVDIPGLVTDIEEYAFKDCNVKTVYSYLFDPFTIGQNTFSPYANANATLYIPNLEDTEMKYLYDTQWSQFLNRYRMDKSFNYDDFYGTGDINFTCGDDPLKGNPNAKLFPGAGLTMDTDCDSTQHIGNVEIEGDGKDWASIIAGCNLNVDSLIQNIIVAGKKWHFFGFPFEVKIEDILSDAKFVIYEYDGQARAERDTTGWKRLPKEQKYLYPGHGYIFQFNFAVSGSFTIRIAHPDFCEAIKKVLLVFFPSQKDNNKSWNYAANPFMAYYDINDLNTTSPITYWDVQEGTYKSVRPGDDEYFISPYEGFFLQNEFNHDFELVFDRNKAMTKRQMDERKASRAGMPQRAKKAHNGRYIINLTLTGDTLSDATRVVINEQAVMGYDLGKDAAKFLSTETNVPQIFSYDDNNVQYSINERPMESGVVELGVRIPASGVYTIDASRVDTLFYLLDREQNIMHDFSNGAYMFSSGAGVQSNRFALVRQYNAPTDVEENTENVKIDVTADGLYIHGTADIQVYNMAGVIVADGTYSGAVALPAGVYMVVQGGNTTKCVVR